MPTMIGSDQAVRPPCSLEESYRFCARLTRAEARNFYYAFWFLPRRRRRGVYAVYAFSRRLDDIVDGGVAGARPGGGVNLAGIERLERMRSLLDPATPSNDPLAPALRDTVERFNIPVKHFDELIAGMVMDLEGREYRTFEDLRLYCYRAAATVGLICIEIFGHAATAGGRTVEEPAVDLGLAMQLTNIVRDIPEDLERGRVYLPADELLRFGVSVESLRRRRVDDRFRSLMRFQVERARSYFRSAGALFPLLDSGSRRCPALLSSFYGRILAKIEAAGYDVFRRRPALTRVEKLGLAVRLWLRSIAGGDHHSSR